jgi:hypothetical protein
LSEEVSQTLVRLPQEVPHYSRRFEHFSVEIERVLMAHPAVCEPWQVFESDEAQIIHFTLNQDTQSIIA